MKENMNQEDTFSASDTKKTYNVKKTVLVIDDELGPRESLKILLKSSHNVVTRDSGESGIEYMKNQDVDAVILDLRMPGISGIETLERIREFDDKTPVIILTGYGDMKTAQKAMHFGAVEFLNKPFDINEMIEIVKQACQKKEVEKKSAVLIKDLDSLNKKLKDNMARMENMATIGKLSAEIIHDVNNILTVIYGYVQLLMSGSDNSSKNNYINTIQQEIDKCRNMTTNVMELSKLRMDKQPININGTVRKIADFFSNSGAAKHIKFSVQEDKNIPFVEADPSQLHKALVNIVLNSIQAIEKKGMISIATKKENNYAVITVTDNGKGIEPEIAEKIFESSFTTKPFGTGLGLSIAERVVKSHNGKIEIESDVKMGTTVKIYLPAGSK